MENRRTDQSFCPPPSKRAEGPEQQSRLAFSGVSLVELLRFRAAVQPLATAYTFLRDGEQESDFLTYEVLDRRSRAIAAQLQSLCRPGDRALLLYQPGLEFISAFFGCLYAGLVAVPAYPPSLTRSDRALARLRAIAADAHPAVILSTEELVSNLARAAADSRDLLSSPTTGAIDGRIGSDWIASDTVLDDNAALWRDPGPALTHWRFCSTRPVPQRHRRA